jgi:hypothetical protein
MICPLPFSCLFLLLCGFSRLAPIAASPQPHPVGSLNDSTQQAPSQSPARISGHVYRADTGEPISDAVVSLEPQQTAFNGFFPHARTESDGSFMISEAPPGVYSIDANAVGFLPKSYGVDGPQSRPKPVSIKPSQIIDGIDFRLDAAGAISGSVYDDNGKPVAGVMVLAAHAEYRPNGDRQIGFGDGMSTDEDGTFYISGLRPGSYYVRAGGEDRNPGHRFNFQAKYYPNASLLDDAELVQVTSGAEKSGIQIRGVKSEPAYTIKVNIIDPAAKSGQRRHDVTVNRSGSAPALHSLKGESAEATFSLDGFSPGEYTVTAWAIDPADQGWKVSGRGYVSVRVADEDVEVNVDIGNGGEVRGKVSLESSPDVQIPRVRVVLSSSGHLGLNGGTSVSGQNGEFDVPDVPPGRYSFTVFGNAVYVKSARCSGRDYTIEPIDVGAGTVLSDCEITLGADMASISGQVLDEIKPVPDWVVVAIPESIVLRQKVGYFPTAQTDSNGQFKIPWAIPGDYFLFAVPPSEDHPFNAPDFANRNQADAQHVSLKPNVTEIVRLKPSNIK